MINWEAFLVVAAATLVSAVAVVSVYSLGVRLLSVSADGRIPEERAEPASDGSPPARGVAGYIGRRYLLARLGAYACFVVSGLAVLYGVYLIVPLFH